MISARPLPYNDWESEDDARTLARAEEIKGDTKRYNKAVAAAKRLVKERKNNLDALSKVAGKKISNNAKYNERFINSVENARR